MNYNDDLTYDDADKNSFQADDTCEDNETKNTEQNSQKNCVLATGENHMPEQIEHDHLICANQIVCEPPKWLCEPYFLVGAGGMIQGAPGIGKTAFACYIAAHVTNGQELRAVDSPDSYQIKQGAVLMLSIEDDREVLTSRFIADGGDKDILYFLNNAYKLSLSNDDELNEIENSIKRTNARLLIIDPLQAFIGDIDYHRANKTRPVLARLFEMAKRNQCAVLIIAHTGKGAKEYNPVQRSLGSTDIAAACRSILHVEKLNPDSDEIAAYHVKSNSAPQGKTIIYTIGDSGSVQVKRFTNDSIYQAERLERNQPERRECELLILGTVANCPIESTRLDQICQEAGFSRSTKDRAKSDLHSQGKIRYESRIKNGNKVTYVLPSSQ